MSQSAPLLPQLGAPPSACIVTDSLGDCFLLAFAGVADTVNYVLIDCGVFLGTPNAQARMQRIVADIEVATGGRLDVLVATHEHWDHLAGFSFARDVVFKRLCIGEVWVAWTEDAQHPLAGRLQQQRQQALTALAAEVQHLLDFYGPLAAAGATASTRESLQFVQTLAPVRYCRPGELLRPLPGGSGVRVFALGPPEDEKLLKQSAPGGGKRMRPVRPRPARPKRHPGRPEASMLLRWPTLARPKRPLVRHLCCR